MTTTKQNNYILRLEKYKKACQANNIKIDDITILYCDFIECKKINKFNYLWKEYKDIFKKAYLKKASKDNFNKVLFSKIIYNWLYSIRQFKNDLVPYYAEKDSPTYLYYASHQYIRKELEKMSHDQMIYLSYKLACTFKK